MIFALLSLFFVGPLPYAFTEIDHIASGDTYMEEMFLWFPR